MTDKLNEQTIKALKLAGLSESYEYDEELQEEWVDDVEDIEEDTKGYLINPELIEESPDKNFIVYGTITMIAKTNISATSKEEAVEKAKSTKKEQWTLYSEKGEINNLTAEEK